MNHQPDADSFSTLVARFLGGRLPEEMAAAISFEALPADVKRFIMRMLTLMQKADFPATDITPVLIWQLSNIIPGFLPCTWDGRVPPLTLARRNARIDAYVMRYNRQEPLVNPVFVDMGCGFPPVTTLESASTLHGWRVFGVDRSFSEYAVYDPEGNYACFDAQGMFQYFQPTMNRERIRMYRNVAEARSRFEKVFKELHPLLRGTPGQAGETVEKDGHRLVRHLIRSYEAPGLTFVESEMENVQIPPAHAIRCMNTLVYFDSEARRRLLVKAGSHLVDTGILITGANLMSGATCRYLVYRRAGNRLEPVEFAFSADNLRSTNVMPWYTLHDDDPEALLLAGAIRRIRADRSFWPVFSGRLDESMAHYGLLERGPNGFLRPPKGDDLALDFSERAARLWRQIEEEGFSDGAVAALKRAGIAAWKNSVGDIAFRPHLQTSILPDWR